MKTTDTPDGLAALSLAEVVLEFPCAAPILHQLNFDYCCGGKKLFADACRDANLSPEEVWKQVEQQCAKPVSEIENFDGWSTPRLLDFIEEHHHSYVRNTVTSIEHLLTRVCNAHGEEHKFLWDVKEQFLCLADDLTVHLVKEESVLFPRIRELVTRQGGYYLPATSHPLDGPINMMEDDHDEAGNILQYIRKVTNHYTPPADACPTFRLCYKSLAEFDENLTEHIHLENNIVFARMKRPGEPGVCSI